MSFVLFLVFYQSHEWVVKGFNLLSIYFELKLLESCFSSFMFYSPLIKQKTSVTSRPTCNSSWHFYQCHSHCYSQSNWPGLFEDQSFLLDLCPRRPPALARHLHHCPCPWSLDPRQDTDSVQTYLLRDVSGSFPTALGRRSSTCLTGIFSSGAQSGK